jgi:hypothetical protein
VWLQTACVRSHVLLGGSSASYYPHSSQWRNNTHYHCWVQGRPQPECLTPLCASPTPTAPRSPSSHHYCRASAHAAALSSATTSLHARLLYLLHACTAATSGLAAQARRPASMARLGSRDSGADAPTAEAGASSRWASSPTQAPLLTTLQSGDPRPCLTGVGGQRSQTSSHTALP